MSCVRPGMMIAASFVLLACGTRTSYLPMNPPPRPPVARNAEQVEMFTASKPTRPFVEVGMVSAAIASGYSSANEMEVMQALREEAGKHGCDGVVITGENKMATGSSSMNTVQVNERTASFRATCIMYRDESASASAPAPAPASAPAPAPATSDSVPISTAR